MEHLSPAPSTGIDIEASEAAFSELETRLTALEDGTNVSSAYSRNNSFDVESGNTYDNENHANPFNLEETLRGVDHAAYDIGSYPKHIGVLWENLTVTGSGGGSKFVKTFPDAVISFFNIYETAKMLFAHKKKKSDIKILDSFRGLVTPGEMVLVLGRPGSGCTTFLKVITNQRFGYTSVDGEVRYGSYDAKTFAAKFRGETVYNQEADIHHPTLTVGQTLEFALDTKMPAKRPGGMSKAEFKEQIITTLLKIFNIEHTRNTVVGGPLLRGVSGGERKRVSIAEMLITSATVCAWDNSTRGLDASTALDYVKSLRIMTNLYKTSTFVSLYQASESIYRLFDKVLVIDNGKEVFFGPTHQARAYFESLGFKEKPRLTTPDFLTSCTDEYEREYTEDYLSENMPHTSEKLAAAFNQSTHAQSLETEMIQYRQTLKEDTKIFDNFEYALKESKMKGASKKSVYSAPFYLQVWILVRRCFLIKWQDKFKLWVTWFTSIVTAFILGSVWFKLPQTSAGAFTRGGLLYIALLNNALEAFSELASTMTGRPILNKHKSFTFYRPSALLIAEISVQLAFSAAKILAFSVIVYFMCGLAREVGAFFTFYIFIIIVYLAMDLLYRTLGILSPDFDVAIKLAVTITMLLILTAGYLIQYQSQKVWIRWMYFINPLGLGFSSLMENEFSKINLICTSESLIPFGPGYTNLANQVCTLPGSIANTAIVSGSNYIAQAFSHLPGQLWRNFGIIIAIIIVLLIANLSLGEIISWGAAGNTTKVFQKPNKKREKLNAALIQKREKNHTEKTQGASEDELRFESKPILTWEDLCYDVPAVTGQIRLLNNIYGYVRPGTLTALMGASGAGKTTLLDVLAARKTIGIITGDILIDGIKLGASFQRGAGYAEQMDVHEPTQTVREALRFSADLRQSYDVPQSKKYEYVEEIISLLEMEDMADAIIGDPTTGLSVEQQKRVTIGVELAAKPDLLLFLDEPTSGLDSQSAFNIIRFLQKLAKSGQAILCTIHQPNAALFEKFDYLLLLQRSGRSVYFGEIGEDAAVLRNYFQRHGAICPPDANVAEWMLEAIGTGQSGSIGDRDWADIWAESPELVNLKESISQMKRQRIEQARENAKPTEKEFASPFFHQLKIVQARTNLLFWRSPNYGFTRLYNHVMLGTLTGVIYFNLDNSQSSLQYRIFIIFQAIMLPAFIFAQVQTKYAISRMIYYREASAKMYSSFVFALSMVVAEIPYSILCAVAFFIPFYYMPHLQRAPSRVGYQLLMVLITEFFAVTLGQLLAAVTPSPFISSLLAPFIMITFALFSGVTIPKPLIPVYWRVWLYELNPLTRLTSGMIVTELHGLPVACKSSELNIFNAPAGQSCESYMRNFFNNGGPGYLINNVTSACQYCAYKTGDQFYRRLSQDYGTRWRDFGIFFTMLFSNLILLLLAARYLNFNRR